MDDPPISTFSSTRSHNGVAYRKDSLFINASAVDSTWHRQLATLVESNNNNEITGSATRTYTSSAGGEPLEETWTRSPQQPWFKQPYTVGDPPSVPPIPLSPASWDRPSQVASFVFDRDNTAYVLYNRLVTLPAGSLSITETRTFPFYIAGDTAPGSLLQLGDESGAAQHMTITEQEEVVASYYTPAVWPLPPNTTIAERVRVRSGTTWQTIPPPVPPQYTTSCFFVRPSAGKLYIVSPQGIKKLAPGAPWPEFRPHSLGAYDAAAFALDSHGCPSYCSGATFTRTYQPRLGDQDPFCSFEIGPNTTVNIATGNLFFSLPIFSSNGRGISTSFSLAYNSLESDRLASPISPGWTHNYNIYLTANRATAEEPMPDFFYLTLGDGRKIQFYTQTVEPQNQPPQTWAIPQLTSQYYARIERNQVAGQWFYVMTTKSGMRYLFDLDSGKLVRIEDTNANVLTLDYVNNLLTTITDSAGRCTTLQYDGQNRLVSVRDPLNNQTTLVYSQDRLRSVLLPPASAGATPYEWQFLYHPLPDGCSTPLGSLPDIPTTHPEKQILDPLKELVHVHQPLAAIATPRGVVGRTETPQAELSYGTRFFYYADNRFAFSADPYDKIRCIIYDADNPPPPDSPSAYFRDRNYARTRVFYTSFAQAVKVVDNEGHTIERKFDAHGNVVRFKDKNDNVTLYAYDERDFEFFEIPPGPWYGSGVPAPVPFYVGNNLLAVMEPGDPETGLQPAVTYYRYTTDGFNRVAGMRDPEGAETTYEYDSRGNLTRILYPHPQTGVAGGGGEQRYEYDHFGRIVSATNPNGKVTQYFYDEPGDNGTGLVTSILAPGASQRERFEYDRMGNVIKRKPPVAAATTYELDNLYRVKKIIAPQNRVTVYTYDEDSNVLRVDPPQGASTTHRYDKLGRLRFSDTGLHGSEYRYDANGNVIWSRSNLTISTFQYDSLNRLTREQRTGAGHTNYWYYPDGSLRREERWGQHVESTEYQYDSRGNLTQSRRSSTAPHTPCVFTYNRYTTAGQLRETWRESAGQTGIDAVTYEYDKRGRMISTTRLTGSPDPAQNPTTRFWYDNVGNRIAMTDPMGKNTYFEYDAADRLICTRDHDGNITAAYEYNDDGQRTKVLVPNPQGGGLVVQQEFIYNQAGELVSTVSPADDSANVTHFDHAGNVVRRIDAEGNFVEYVYDEYNRVVEMHEHPTLDAATAGIVPISPIDPIGSISPIPTYDPDAIITRYEYDLNGNRTKVIDPRGNEYRYEYNSLNQLIRIVYPLGGQETYEYDLLGNLVRKTDPNGQVSEYFYDGFSRNVRETHTLNGVLRQEILRTYDAAGNLASIEQTQGLPVKILYWYNSLNQLVATHWYVNGVFWKGLSYSYDLAGNRVGMTGPEGEQVVYGYDNSHRLVSITRTPSASEIAQGVYPQPLTCTFEYDAAGRRRQMVLANGVRALYNYDQKGRLENLRWVRSTGDTIASFSYTYNRIDNIMRKRLDHLNVDFDYSYNRVSWLTGEVCSGNANVTPPPHQNQFAAVGGGNESLPSNEVVVTPAPPVLSIPAYGSYWTYDRSGNRLSKQSTLFGNATYQYDQENRLLVEHTPDGDIVYGYDNNGNTISRTKTWNNEVEQYLYAWNNQINGYINPQGQIWSYLFTAEARQSALLYR